MIARAADFQASWYFSLLALIIIAIVIGATGWVVAGAWRMWQRGEHAPALMVAGAAVFGLVAMLGMYAVALGGIVLNSGSGG